jgi:RecA-family ATPase
MSDLIIKTWQQQPGDYFFLAAKRGASFESFAIKRKDIERRVPEIIAEESVEKNMYWCPHGFSAPRRVKENAVLPKLLYADLDEANPRNMKPRPTIALESSPGRYVGFWIVDRAITEDLNRRLTLHVGADKAGYDLTQVLRVPNTQNFKYASRPVVKTLWANGPEYTVAQIEKLLPKPRKDADKIADKAWEIWKPYAMKSLELTNLIRGDKPADRSGRQAKAYEQMFDLGLSTTEIEIIWRAVPWGKGSDYDEEKRPGWLRKDIERVLGKEDENPFVKRSHDEYEEESKVVDDLWDSKIKLADGFFNMKEVEATDYEWIFHPFFARGEMTLVQGDPKCGKSYSLQMIALRIARGLGFDKFSERQNEPVKGKVIYFDPENDPSKITANRLRWNGFNPAKHDNFYVQAYSSSIGSEEFREYVYELMNTHKPVMVIFDTLLHFSLGDANSNADMTRVMGWFTRLARQYNCSVVVVRHMKKSSGRDAMTSGSGATAIAGVTRLVATVGYHPEDEDIRIISSTKGSMTSNKLRVPGFRIESVVGGEPDQSKLTWEKELFEIDSDAMIAQNMKAVSSDGEKKRAKWMEYADSIKKQFENADQITLDGVLRQLHAEGLDSSKVAEKHYTRARTRLGIASERVSVGGRNQVVWKVTDQKAFDSYKHS